MHADDAVAALVETTRLRKGPRDQPGVGSRHTCRHPPRRRYTEVFPAATEDLWKHIQTMVVGNDTCTSQVTVLPLPTGAHLPGTGQPPSFTRRSITRSLLPPPPGKRRHRRTVQRDRQHG